MKLAQSSIELFFIFWIFALNISTEKFVEDSIPFIEELIIYFYLFERNDFNDFQFSLNIKLLFQLYRIYLRQITNY
jgi:hypothetical protein